MKSLKTILLFIVGIVWIFCFLIAMAGFGIFCIWIGDIVSGGNSLIEMTTKACVPRVPSYCLIENTYQVYLNNRISFIVYTLFAIIGLGYIKRKSLSSNINKIFKLKKI